MITKQEGQEKTQKKQLFMNQIPLEILDNVALNKAIAYLPQIYNFEIHKSIWRIQEIKKKLNKQKLIVSLQFPEGLMLYACLISDILSQFTESETVITGDVTYGACCIDDLTASQLGADFIIHYGHSCLIPINETIVQTLYVFVELNLDLTHFLKTFEMNFSSKEQIIYLLGTIQFNTVIYQAKQKLNELGYSNIIIPQEKPRSQGEVLGCTSPKFSVNKEKNNIVVFICDGRFHIESTMIQNPEFQFYQYNPYTQELTIESYDNKQMMNFRQSQINQCKQMGLKFVCVILGTLGRQGSPQILDRIQQVLQKYQIEFMVLLVSEINFDQLNSIKDEVDCFIQIACPRLSIDWGPNFNKPLLTPYELFVVLGEIQWKEIYPMDYYSNEGGVWTNYYHKQNVSKSNQICSTTILYFNLIQFKECNKNKIKLKFEN